MTNNNLSVVIMHMIKERAMKQTEKLEETIRQAKEMRKEINSPLTKADLNEYIDYLTARVSGLDMVTGAFEEYTQDEWCNLMALLNDLRERNYAAFTEADSMLYIDGKLDWIVDMWQDDEEIMIKIK